DRVQRDVLTRDPQVHADRRGALHVQGSRARRDDRAGGLERSCLLHGARDAATAGGLASRSESLERSSEVQEARSSARRGSSLLQYAAPESSRRSISPESNRDARACAPAGTSGWKRAAAVASPPMPRPARCSVETAARQSTLRSLPWPPRVRVPIPM